MSESPPSQTSGASPPDPPSGGGQGGDGADIGAAAGGPWAWLARVLVDGPDPRRPGEARGFLGTLLPWPVRWLLVVAAAVIGGVWADAGIAEQLAWGLDYAALIGVSLAASYWRPILFLNLALSAAWFVPFRARRQSPGLWRLLHVVTFLNRQVGHFEALSVWIAIALVAWPKLSFQLPFLAGVLLLGPPLINGLARIKWTGEQAQGTKKSGNLNWRRRPFIYAATFVGLVSLAMQARHQAMKLVPIAAAIIVGGLAPRFVRAMWRGRNVKEESRTQQEGRLEDRAEFRAAQMRYAGLDFAFGPVVVLLLATGAIVFAWQQRRAYDQALQQQINPAGGGDVPACLRDPGGPVKAETSLFIVSDSQMHELQERRFPGQIELADVFVPVAIRPVELDVLSVATLARFAQVYRQLGAGMPPTGSSLGWAHLGDFADLSCVGEMARAVDMMARFQDGRLVGLAPGNHDKSFTGNFFWSPFWDVACRKRLEKVDSDAMLRAAAAGRLVSGALMRPVDDGGGLRQRVSGRGSALVTVSPLGLVHHRGRQHGVIGVFLDTADEKAFDFGIAGLFGTVSKEQVKALLGMIHELQQAQADAAFRDPVYVLFGHHPFDEITSDSQKQLGVLIARLDRAADPLQGAPADGDIGEDDASGAADGDDGASPRVLALITAHTHLAQAAYRCLAGRYVREIVVGSTIDPPQEASLLTVGADERGRAALRVRTLPAIAREGLTCGDEPVFTARQCQQVMGALAEAEDCRPLFDADAPAGLPTLTRSGPRPDCQVLERSLSLTERLAATRDYQGPDTADGIKKAQVVRARRLFRCLCRDGRCTPPAAAVRLEDDRAYHDFLLRAMESGPAEQRVAWTRELTCLSWAASEVQAHKAAGMTMADALRCGFDDTTLPPAKEYVSVLEARSCD